MKIIVTTSNAYLHLIPVFSLLFNKFWSSSTPVEIVGYDAPKCELPDNMKFVSLGKQIGDATNFSTDLREYFKTQPQFFVWLMEDTFLKAPVDFRTLDILKKYQREGIGRINLTDECTKQIHQVKEYYTADNAQLIPIFGNAIGAQYRLSTQPSIWNRDFLLTYLTPGLNPWQFETQATDKDYYEIIGLNALHAPVKHNEGVRKYDIHKLNLEGMPQPLVDKINQML